LLADVEAHKVDTIVVYKVDRLTRSVADFAKIVEPLDGGAVRRDLPRWLYPSGQTIFPVARA
jgi:hypothetical protein